MAAPFPGDTVLYRAKVIEVQGSDVDLYYVDYGDSGIRPAKDVRHLRFGGMFDEFHSLNNQAS